MSIIPNGSDMNLNKYIELAAAAAPFAQLLQNQEGQVTLEVSPV